MTVHCHGSARPNFVHGLLFHEPSQVEKDLGNAWKNKFGYLRIHAKCQKYILNISCTRMHAVPEGDVSVLAILLGLLYATQVCRTDAHCLLRMNIFFLGQDEQDSTHQREMAGACVLCRHSAHHLVHYCMEDRLRKGQYHILTRIIV
jgi:hypothetical protein